MMHLNNAIYETKYSKKVASLDNVRNILATESEEYSCMNDIFNHNEIPNGK